MKFTVNSGVFTDCLFSCIEVATKNYDKDWDGSEKISFTTKKDEIIAVSHGGTASIITSISNKNISDLNYKCEIEGVATTGAINFNKSISAIPPSKNICIDTSGGEMIISFQGEEKEESQTVTLEDEEVKPPMLAKKFKQEVKINREVFIEGINKAYFAIGWAETMPYYMVELFEVESTRARFMAGTGARFAIVDIEGKNIIDVSEKQRYFLPKNNIPNLVKILSNSTEKDVIVKYAEMGKNTNSPAQIVIDFNKKGMLLVLLGIDPSIRYPEPENVINFNYPYKISSNLEDWKYTIAGADATYTPEIKAENDIHSTDITANLKKKYFLIETKSKMKANRTIKFSSFIADSKEQTNPSFRCNTNYITEAYKEGNKSGEVTIEFEDRSLVEDKKPRPVLIRFPDKPNNSRGTIEKFMIFFATSKR